MVAVFVVSVNCKNRSAATEVVCTTDLEVCVSAFVFVQSTSKNCRAVTHVVRTFEVPLVTALLVAELSSYSNCVLCVCKLIRCSEAQALKQ